jgi:hypothetical protein
MDPCIIIEVIYSIPSLFFAVDFLFIFNYLSYSIYKFKYVK